MQTINAGYQYVSLFVSMIYKIYPRRGHLPNFCIRVCQRNLQNHSHTLSLAKFVKKTPFLLQFFCGKHAVLLLSKYTLCSKAHPSSCIFAPKHTLCPAFFVKITPLMLAHPRYCIIIYSECPLRGSTKHANPVRKF